MILNRSSARTVVPAACLAACLAGLVLAGCGDETEAPADAAVDTPSGGDSSDGSVGGDTNPEVAGGDAADATPQDAADTGSSDVAPGAVLVPRPLRFDEDLVGVWGSAADDVWIVGAKGRILHWNGQTLAPRASGTVKDLHGVGGRGPAEAWFAGDGVVLQWNGKAMKDVTPAEAKGVVLRSLHAAPDGTIVVAAGDAGVVLRRKDDGTWAKEDTGSTTDLYAIRAVGPGQIWAVGKEGMALRFSAGSWQPGTKMPDASQTLRALAVSPGGRLFAAGDAAYLAAHDGTWKTTLVNDDRDLHGLWAVSNTDAWAIGKQGALLHLQGEKKWSVETISGTYMMTKSFSGLWGQGAGDTAYAIAVGPEGAGVVFNKGKWLDFKAETVADLRSVTALAGGGLAACGKGGLLLLAADAQAPFYDLAAPVTAADLNDVAGAGDGLWAVGAGGVVLHRDGKGAFTLENLPGGGDLNGVAVLGDGSVVAVGDKGVAAVRSPGTGWAIEPTGTQLPLRSVAVAGGVAFAVGGLENSEGVILRRDASGKWSAENASGGLGLRRVAAWGDGEAAAVGDGGTVLLRQNGTWKVAFEAPGVFLHGIARRPDGTLVAAGWGGQLVAGKPGGAFALVPGGVATVLYGIAATPQGTVAVGMKGGIFQVTEKLP